MSNVSTQRQSLTSGSLARIAPVKITSPPRISVCIPTFRRNDRLRAVLDDLAKQHRAPDQVVVVDNEPNGGSRTVIEAFRATRPPFPIDYAIQPEPNIAITRNRTVELATGDWLAFVDDDERAPPDWLDRLFEAAVLNHADGVLAPVEPQVPETAPRWIRRGKFYDFPHQPEGAEVPLNCMRFGNVLLRTEMLRAEPGPFDPACGLMAGEDVDLLVRLARKGARIVWTERAPVYEPIESKRLSLRWLLLRGLSGGQSFARYTLQGGFRPISLGGRIAFVLRSVLQMFVALGLALPAAMAGRHRGAAWLVKACANFGKITVLWGWRYRAYARRG